MLQHNISMFTFQGFRRHLSLHIYSCKHIPGDVILHDGDPLVNVTLVCKGSLEVMKDGKLVGILGGEFVPEGNINLNKLVIIKKVR